RRRNPRAPTPATVTVATAAAMAAAATAVAVVGTAPVEAAATPAPGTTAGATATGAGAATDGPAGGPGRRCSVRTMPESWVHDRRPVRRVVADEHADRSRWPATVPAVAQLLDEGLDLAPGVTLLVGEN